MELVTRQWSGKHGRVVQGINLITLLWTEGDRHIPLDEVTSEFGKDRTLRVCKRLQQPDLTSFIASSSARHNPSQIDIFLTLLENGRF